MGDVFIWSSVEPCIGIVCACLPTLQPLLKSTLKRILGSSRVAGNFGASSSQEVELQGKARIQRVSGGHDKRRLLRSLDDSQHGNNDERLILRPKEDEAILTTNSEPAEGTKFAGGNAATLKGMKGFPCRSECIGTFSGKKSMLADEQDFSSKPMLLPPPYERSTSSTLTLNPMTASVLESETRHGQNGFSFPLPAEILGIILKSAFTPISN